LIDISLTAVINNNKLYLPTVINQQIITVWKTYNAIQSLWIL